MFRAAALAALAAAAPAPAGLYYSGERFAEPPSRWRGFLLDQQALRRLAVPPGPGVPPDPLRDQYLDALRALEGRPLTADEQADRGALLVRLGRPAEAVAVLRAAHRDHPGHFRAAANLGTAWQLAGDLAQAEAALEAAVRLAPPADRAAERLHLRLVRLRRRAAPGALDDLFGVAYDPARPAAARAALPADAVALVQRLALALPDDGRLLWQLGELAAAGGDARTAALILDACVGEFGMSSPVLRDHRRAARAAADAGGHADHRPWAFRSARPLARRFDASRLPPVRADGVNDLPWPLLADTAVGPGGRPAFPDRVRALDGRRVRLTGFARPLGDDPGSPVVLVELPVGCWFCETPGPAGMVLVEPPPRPGAGLVKVEGVLRLNATDPEGFLFAVTDAVAAEPD